MVIWNKCCNTCFYLHDRFHIRKLFLVCHDTLRRLVMGGAYPYMNLNAKYGKLLLRCLLQWIQIRISAKRGKCTWNSNLHAKCRTERRFHALKFSDGYTVKPVYSGHLGEFDKMTTICRWPLYEGVWLFDEIFYTSFK
jgi:hypothetical protein